MSKLLGDFPVYAHGRPVGTVTITQDGLMTVFDCACDYPSREVLRLAAVAGGKAVSLGVLAPADGALRLRRRLSKNALASLGYSKADIFQLMKQEEILKAQAQPSVRPGPSGAAETAPEPVNSKATNDAGRPDPPDITAGPETAPSAVPVNPVSAEPDTVADGTISAQTHPNRDAADNPAARMRSMIEQLLKPSDPAEQEQHEPPARQAPDGWSHALHPEALFSDPDVSAACSGVTGALLASREGYQLLAVPISTEEPFPMMSVFCFGSPEEIGGRTYIVFKISDGKLTL